MIFKRVADAFDVCKAHLDSTGARGTEVETFLVSYLLVLISAEYEVLFEELINRRVGRTGDASVCGFGKAAADKLIRSIKIGDMAGLLGYFGCKDAFHSKKDDQAATAYDNILTNRNLVAHNTGVRMTFVEVEAAFTKSRQIFEAVCHALGLTDTELSGLK